jgi:predicted enzyme related to lactoylglutathione lyase
MSTRETYPAGVPCWVETLQPRPREALDFYASLFAWDVDGPGPMPNRHGEYFVARVADRDVAGIGTLPAGAGPSAVWSTQIRVDSVEESARKAADAGGRVLVEPFDALPAGRGAVISDPSGAVFCLWEARARQGAQRVNEPRAWAMSALYTDDLAKAAAFYGSVFGWQSEPFDAGTMKVTLCRLPGYVGGEPQQPVPRDVVAVMMLIDKTSPVPIDPHWSVDFWIDDTDAAVERVAKLGGAVIVAPFDTPAFRQAVVADAQGAVFSLSQLRNGRH